MRETEGGQREQERDRGERKGDEEADRARFV